MAEGARLESVYTATYRGFESPPHRHILRRARMKMRAFFFRILHACGGDENPRPGFDNWRSQLDRLRAKRTGCPQGERSESIPPGAIFSSVRPETLTFSPGAEGSPQINASTEQSPRPFGERVRVRGTYGSGGHSVHFMFLATL